MKRVCLTAALTFLLSGTSLMQAQHIPTLEEVVNGGLIHTKGSIYVNWLEDGEHYSQTEKNPAGGYDIVSFRAKDLKKETLIPASMLVKPGTHDTLSVRSFQFNADHTLALIYTNPPGMALRHAGRLLGAEHERQKPETARQRNAGKQSDVCQAVTRQQARGLRKP